MRLFTKKEVQVELPKNLQETKEFKFTNDIPNPIYQLVKPGSEKIIGSWLLFTAGTVFFMVVVGGYCRLTLSGLSMTRWKPIQPKMPQTEKEWQDEFEHYKQYPEYKLANKNMELDGFKKIFFVEWFHRLIGSSLGFIFSVPFLYFLIRGQIKKPMIIRLMAMLGLGGGQGLIGWWMVKSGMQEKPDYQVRPRVSVYRLFIHLNMAIIIYSLLFWNGLTLIRKPQEQLITPQTLKGQKNLRYLGIILIHFVAFNIMSGACAAGIDAFKVYNTWPLMNDQVVPAGIFSRQPLWRNFFENKALVQFNHRNFGYLTFLATTLTFYKARKLNLLPHQRQALNWVTILVYSQVIDGIITLLRMAPPEEANLHQANALIVLTSVLYMIHTCRNPTNLYATYLKRFV